MGYTCLRYGNVVSSAYSELAMVTGKTPDKKFDVPPGNLPAKPLLRDNGQLCGNSHPYLLVLACNIKKNLEFLNIFITNLYIFFEKITFFTKKSHFFVFSWKLLIFWNFRKSKSFQNLWNFDFKRFFGISEKIFKKSGKHKYFQKNMIFWRQKSIFWALESILQLYLDFNFKFMWFWAVSIGGTLTDLNG